MITGAVLGSPIAHSLSPTLHRGAYKFLGIEGSYSAIEVHSGSLQEFFSSNQDNFDYFSLTMPLKEEALSLGVEIDDIATRIQSANTLVKISGKWRLTSTDGSGLIAALSFAGFDSFKSVLILGAGGTARAIAGALDTRSESIHVLGRSGNRESALSQSVQSAEFRYIPWNSTLDFNDYDLVINTTPAGAADLLAEGLSAPLKPALFDVLYKPWPTVLASKWVDSGALVINGLELLLYQGIDQLSLVLEDSLDRTDLAPHLRGLLKS